MVNLILSSNLYYVWKMNINTKDYCSRKRDMLCCGKRLLIALCSTQKICKCLNGEVKKKCFFFIIIIARVLAGLMSLVQRVDDGYRKTQMHFWPGNVLPRWSLILHHGSWLNPSSEPRIRKHSLATVWSKSS